MKILQAFHDFMVSLPVWAIIPVLILLAAWGTTLGIAFSLWLAGAL